MRQRLGALRRLTELCAEPGRVRLSLEHDTPKWMSTGEAIRRLLDQRPASLDPDIANPQGVRLRTPIRLPGIRKLVNVLHGYPLQASSFRKNKVMPRVRVSPMT